MFWRSGLILTSANVAAQLVSLVRMIVLARMVPLADFGVAATYLLIVTLIEMLSQLGLDRMIVQDRDGESTRLQGALQAIQALRGIAGAAALLAMAWPISLLFGQSEHVGSYRLLAAIPLLGGLMHFDQHRFKREMAFGPASLIIFIPYAGSLAIMLGLSLFIRDHTLMLWAIIGQQAIATALSHLVARRRYLWTWDRKLARRIAAFGMPLLVNGALLFAIMNGERMIVGHVLGMALLAVFTIMLNLSMTPTLVLANSVQAWFLPQLSRLQDEPEAFAPLAQATIQATMMLGLAIATAAALIGPPLAALVAGPGYASGLELFVWLAIGQGIRVAKAGAGIVALAKGFPGNQLAGNVLRVAALPLAWWWVASRGDLIGLAWLAMAAETGGFVISLWLCRRKTGISLRPSLAPMCLCTLCLMLIAYDQNIHPARTGLAEHLHGFQLAYAALAIFAILSMRDLISLFRGRSR